MPKKAITRKSALFVMERVFSSSSGVAQTARATGWSQLMDLLLLLIIALIILSIAGLCVGGVIARLLGGSCLYPPWRSSISN
jgi:hypothetical protein